MDENDMRSVLTALADTAAPPARFDMGQAITDGRHGRRRRQALAGGSALAIGAAIGAVVTIFAVAGPGTPTVPPPAARATAHTSVQPSAPASTAPSTQPATQHSTQHSTQPGAHPTGQAGHVPGKVPAQFNPLVPYASFGWLPKGFTTGASNEAAETSNDATSITAGGRQGSFTLAVMARGGCGYIRTMLNCHTDSGNVTGPTPLDKRAPDVNGRPAYWAYGDSILWEYAAGAWAELIGPGGFNSPPTAAQMTQILKVAAGARYGYQTALEFPFWLSGMPANWSVSTAYYTVSAPPLLAATLDLGPAEKPQAAMLFVVPAGSNNTCQYQNGDSYVTVDGVKAIVQGGGKGSIGQSLCISNLNGQFISVSLSTEYYSNGVLLRVPGAAGIGGALGLFRHLHLLGGQTSNGTTDPLR
jgi:hypothetical protein